MSAELNTPEEASLIGSAEKNTIYADRIFSFAVGPGVTKLHLGMEGPVSNSINAIGTLVLPTHALIESLEFILESVKNNSDMNNQLLTQIDKFRNQVVKKS